MGVRIYVPVYWDLVALLSTARVLIRLHLSSVCWLFTHTGGSPGRNSGERPRTLDRSYSDIRHSPWLCSDGCLSNWRASSRKTRGFSSYLSRASSLWRVCNPHCTGGRLLLFVMGLDAKKKKGKECRYSAFSHVRPTYVRRWTFQTVHCGACVTGAQSLAPLHIHNVRGGCLPACLPSA